MLNIQSFRTGIPPMDYALPEGFPKGATVVISGEPGSGKTVMVSNLAWNVLSSNGSVIYVNFDDSPDAILELFEGFNWSIKKYISNGSFGIIDCFTFLLGRLRGKYEGVIKYEDLQDMDAVIHDIYSSVTKASGNVKLVIFDSLNELMFRLETIQVLEVVKKVRALISKGLGATVVMTLHISTDSLRELAAHLEYLVDGSIITRVEPSMREIGIPLKQLMVRKMRSLPTNSFWIPYVITDQGIAPVDPKKLALLVQQKIKEAESFKVSVTGSKGEG